MKIEEKIRQEGGLFAQEIKVVRISDVQASEATKLFDALRHEIGWNRGRRTRFEVYVSGKGFSGGDAWESITDVEHFLCGYELAMLMNGIDVKASWYKPD